MMTSVADKSKKTTITSFASSMLAKVSFLCTVLLEDPDSRHLAFRIGLYGMEMPRPPAASKSLEVRVSSQFLLTCCCNFFYRSRIFLLYIEFVHLPVVCVHHLLWISGVFNE
jgi:hypothetical protein